MKKIILSILFLFSFPLLAEESQEIDLQTFRDKVANELVEKGMASDVKVEDKLFIISNPKVSINNTLYRIEAQVLEARRGYNTDPDSICYRLGFAKQVQKMKRTSNSIYDAVRIWRNEKPGHYYIDDPISIVSEITCIGIL